MDEELSDLEINFAQLLLKEQFPKLISTLYQDKKWSYRDSALFMKPSKHSIISMIYWTPKIT